MNRTTVLKAEGGNEGVVIKVQHKIVMVNRNEADGRHAEVVDSIHKALQQRFYAHTIRVKK